MLKEKTLFGDVDKVQIAIRRLQEFEPKDNGYYVAFSGGKDSLVVKDLVKKAGVKAEFHFNRSMEPPEVIYYIRKYHPDVIRHMPKHSMWELIIKNGIPPNKLMRYCCREMKENAEASKGRLVVTGVRHAESLQRKGRQMVEQCRNDNSKRFLHPIIDWTTAEVWQYIHENNLPYCELYDEGRTRIGCVMCPMSNQKGMLRDAKRWPKIAAMYEWSCCKAFKARIAAGKKTLWKNGHEMYYAWTHNGKHIEEQDKSDIFFFGQEGEDEE